MYFFKQMCIHDPADATFTYSAMFSFLFVDDDVIRNMRTKEGRCTLC